MNSLAARLLVAAGLVLLAFVALTGLALERAVYQRALQAERDKLQGLTYALLGSAEIGDDGSFRLPERSLPDSDLARPGGGLYALVTDGDGAVIWQSPSIIDFIAPPPAPGVGQWRFVPPEAGDNRWIKLALGIRWVAGEDQDYRFTLMVAESAEPLTAQLERFRGVLWLWLSGAAGLLLAVQLAILRWGLAPVRRLSRSLRDIEAGRRERIEGQHPKELRSLVRSLNALLASEKARLERYRNALADLAHALKTPVAVLRGMTNEPALPDEQRRHLQGQLARINEIVDYQVQRAAAAGTRTLAPPVALAPIVERLAGALRKVYAEAGTHFEVALDRRLTAAADEGDLTEVIGNVMDNAAKYGRGRVQVSGKAEGDGTVIFVDDDGDGFPDEEPDALLQRGVRADARREGQGIGLAVAAEIVKAYGGDIHLTRSPTLGGGRVSLRLPG
ncbi:MAG: ATP-binding protein [Salinisphaeraceae bacterium]